MASEASSYFIDGQRVVTKAPPWHLAVTLDLFLSSIASGTFILAAVLLLISPVRWAVPAMIGFVVSFVVETADLLALVCDLGDPLRFHHMLRMMKLRSPMSLGVWLSSGLASFAFLASVISLLIARGNLNLVDVWEINAAIGLVFAFGVAMYKGVLLSATSQPVWGELRWLGTDLSISAGACGCATMLTIAAVLGDLTAMMTLRPATGIVLILQASALGFTLQHTNRVLKHRTGGTEIIFWNVMAIVVGGVLPALLALLPLPIDVMEISSYVILALTLAGAFAFKHLLVTIPHRLSQD